jgi:hypothetical protein
MKYAVACALIAQVVVPPFVLQNLQLGGREREREKERTEKEKEVGGG